MEQTSMLNFYYYFNDSMCLNKPSEEHSITFQEISVQEIWIQMSKLSFIEKHQPLVKENGVKQTHWQKNHEPVNNFQIPDICFFK